MNSSLSINLGDLVTWRVDYEESISRIKIVNANLEVGLALDEKIRESENLIFVCWFSGSPGGWCPKGSLRTIRSANTQREKKRKR